MNRIILIGNGFDLAHGLKTSYRDFIDDYWRDFISKVYNDAIFESYEDGLVKFDAKGYQYNTGTGDKEPVIYLEEGEKLDSYQDIKSLIAEFYDMTDDYYSLDISISCINKFFEQISEHVADINWAGIEHEYYERLRKCKNHKEAEVLNKELKQIERLLEEYLTKVCKQDVKMNQSIKDAIMQPPINNEIAFSKKEMLIREIYAASLLSTNHPNILVKRYVKENNKYLNNIKIKKTLFLNFNYTQTPNLYHAPMFENHIHIHGELNNPKNPIIFGYGDELAEDYKQIENLNDNEYLKNVKSIRYLETDNYRKMLSFIESEPYQIFVMGHSCGNSDRTLLNTLFEHENCVSIKPFYHLREDGTDNYNEIVQNISRNFTNKAAMRERVVNKTYCEPLT
ncbi:AbiH family protein [uncultured Dysgonomonas sp.]|uniref:Bacteriophage abortive infection AbiH n=1 Tax=uncultured Dysgonomonas sp. TaxID=206096 RepID=A0A212K2Q0_9BACT|nr:AbiH family protein [uncultured Dysgonomonas sp.]SBW06020.1 conserved hypothetical protein [uncultured Dysgonomonas sp.]